MQNAPKNEERHPVRRRCKRKKMLQMAYLTLLLILLRAQLQEGPVLDGFLNRLDVPLELLAAQYILLVLAQGIEISKEPCLLQGAG